MGCTTINLTADLQERVFLLSFVVGVYSKPFVGGLEGETLNNDSGSE
jgi:hypothetical protein